jgi:hypothetical protein
MPIDLIATESFLLVYTNNGRRYAVSVAGRTEAEARHRLAGMSEAEKRRRIVGTLSRQDRDVIADLFDWLAGLVRRRPSRNPA